MEYRLPTEEDGYLKKTPAASVQGTRTRALLPLLAMRWDKCSLPLSLTVICRLSNYTPYLESGNEMKDSSELRSEKGHHRNRPYHMAEQFLVRIHDS